MQRCTLSLTLLALAVLAPACDEAPEDAEAAQTDTDADADEDDSDPDDADDDDSSLPTGPGTGSPDDPDDPGMPTPTEPFSNSLPEAMSAMEGMVYGCTGEDGIWAGLIFGANGSLQVDDGNGNFASGSYSANAGAVTLSVPELGFEESSVEHFVELDVLAGFTTPTLRCGATAIDHFSAGEQTVTDCPTINWISEVSYETNEFTFGSDGRVRHRNWLELLQVPDTLYTDAYGIYVQSGDAVYMVFANRLDTEDEDHAFLTGTLTDEGLLIDQLEPESGACTES